MKDNSYGSYMEKNKMISFVRREMQVYWNTTLKINLEHKFQVQPSERPDFFNIILLNITADDQARDFYCFI